MKSLFDQAVALYAKHCEATGEIFRQPTRQDDDDFASSLKLENSHVELATFAMNKGVLAIMADPEKHLVPLLDVAKDLEERADIRASSATKVRQRCRWQDLAFDLFDPNDRVEFQEIAQLAGTDPSIPITQSNNPALHARLCDSLQSTGGFGMFTYDAVSWMPFAMTIPESIAAVDFSALAEVAGAFDQIEKQQERQRKAALSVITPAKRAKAAAQQPRATGGKFSKKR